MKLLPVILSALFTVSGSVGAFAQETENKKEDTTDVSKNPITGTKKTTRKYKKKNKAAGTSQDTEVKEVTKEKKDGTVEQKVDAEGSSETKPQ